MSISVHGAYRGYLLGGLSLLAFISLGVAASAQTQLPEVVVSAPKQEPKPRPRHVRAAPRTGGADHAGRAAQRQG